MLKLLKHMSPKEWLMALISTAFVAVNVYLELRLPDFMSEITTTIMTEGSRMSDIWRSGGKMLLCAGGSIAASIIVGYFAARIAAAFSMRLRFTVFSKVQSFSLGEINKFSTPSLITRSTNDINQVQMLIAMGLQVMIKAPIMAVWAVLKISGKGYEWTMATGGFILFLLLLITGISLLIIPRFKRIQEMTDSINRVTRENLTGLRVVRAYNAEGYQQRKFDLANRELTSLHLFTSRTTALLFPCMSLVMNGLTLSVYWIGATLIEGAGMADKLVLFSNMVVFSQYAMQVVISFVMLTMIFIMIPRVLVSAKRINEVLETPASVTDGSDFYISTSGLGEVEFKNVSFKYPNAEDYVIRNISFKAHQGETVAFIGSTGSGKSTIINLIPRFYDVSEGQVMVDGIDVRSYPLKQLREKLGYIPQRSVLFTGSVASNVAYGDSGRGESSLEDIKRAAYIAQASDFVETLPEGYDAPISQGGTNVSGGQKQRLSIARAICREPEIFIFDDSFSALDFKTDKNLRKAIKSELSGTTCLIVAQRIGTVRDADRIIVLEEGNLVGSGRHEELMQDCEVYREIALSQLSEEELANG
ncbi:MAG: ABC transporter ATP-binding protein [Clostridiales bacterium]|nr:ABC transporter ATP-binding protein [Clostridiales bacterium]